jgi:opacity protein-like surface antigen
MKKLVLCFFSGLIVFSFSTIAYAEGLYFSGNIGAALLTDADITEPGFNAELESDTGVALGIAVGYAYSNNIRAEIEFAYQTNDADTLDAFGVELDATGDTTNYAGLLNLYYDFVNDSSFIPFITAGIGYAKVELNDFNLSGSGMPNINEDDEVFAYQVGAGVGYVVSEKIILDFKYRYFGTDDPEFDVTEVEYASHNFYVGIRASF